MPRLLNGKGGEDGHPTLLTPDPTVPVLHLLSISIGFKETDGNESEC